MTRKDYELIADALNETRLTLPNDDGSANAPRHTLYTAAITIGSRLAKDNPRFDLERFLTACGF